MASTAKNEPKTRDLDPSQWYTRDEIRDAYQVSDRTLTRWIHTGRLRKKAAPDSTFVYQVTDTPTDKVEVTRLVKQIAEDTGAKLEKAEARCQSLDTRVRELSEINAGLSVQLRQARDDAAGRLKALEDKSQEAETLKAKAEQADDLKGELEAFKTREQQTRDRKRELFAELARLPWFKRKRRRALLYEIAGL